MCRGNTVQGYRSLPRNLKGGRLSLLPGSAAADTKSYSMTCQRRHHGRRAKTPSSAIFNRLSGIHDGSGGFLAANSNDARERRKSIGATVMTMQQGGSSIVKKFCFSFGLKNGMRFHFVLQSGASGERLGWVDLDLGSSPGWWAASTATYCPSRMVEHPKSNSSQPSRSPDAPDCIFNVLTIY